MIDLSSKYHGITVSQLTAGITSIVGVTAGPGVIDVQILGVTGGILSVSGASFASPTLLIAGAHADIYPNIGPISMGVSKFYMGSTVDVVVSIIKYLSEGFDGSGTLNGE